MQHVAPHCAAAPLLRGFMFVRQGWAWVKAEGLTRQSALMRGVCDAVSPERNILIRQWNHWGFIILSAPSSSSSARIQFLCLLSPAGGRGSGRTAVSTESHQERFSKGKASN